MMTHYISLINFKMSYRMNCHWKLILFLFIMAFNIMNALERPCSLHDLTQYYPCSENEGCSQSDGASTGACKCLQGFTRQGDMTCKRTPDGPPSPEEGGPMEPPAPHSQDPTQVLGHEGVSGSSVAAGVLIPLLLLSTVAALVWVGRRQGWMQRIRRLRTRRYDEVHIGQDDDDDDPPLA